VARHSSQLCDSRSDSRARWCTLAGVYAKFTEGFDMPPLAEAKALLSELPG
jgi:hypothetical protein